MPHPSNQPNQITGSPIGKPSNQPSAKTSKMFKYSKTMESKSSKVLNPKAGKKVGMMSLQAKHAKAAFSNLGEGSKDGSVSTEVFNEGKPHSGEDYRLFHPGN
jgi:hypothetical protein